MNNNYISFSKVVGIIVLVFSLAIGTQSNAQDQDEQLALLTILEKTEVIPFNDADFYESELSVEYWMSDISYWDNMPFYEKELTISNWMMEGDFWTKVENDRNNEDSCPSVENWMSDANYWK